MAYFLDCGVSIKGLNVGYEYNLPSIGLCDVQNSYERDRRPVLLSRLVGLVRHHVMTMYCLVKILFF